jgi:hypothetical protein
MRRALLPRRAAALPPRIALPALVVLQLAVAAALGHGQGWRHSTGSAALAACLLTVEVVLLYAIAHRIGGRGAALFAGLLFVLAPAVLAKRYFVTGGGNIDYRTVYRHDVLPTAYGLTGRAELVAACLLLASAWLALAPSRIPPWVAAAASGAAAGGAALAFPHAWLAVCAPVVAAAASRKPLPIAAAAATAGAGLLALALIRHVPHVPFGWHRMGITLGGVREYSWSRRILEYLPLAGLAGLARRSPRAALFAGTLLVALVILPLARPLDLTGYLLVIVPGLPVYWLLAASIPFLVPRRRPASVAALDAPQLTSPQ